MFTLDGLNVVFQLEGCDPIEIMTMAEDAPSVVNGYMTNDTFKLVNELLATHPDVASWMHELLTEDFVGKNGIFGITSALKAKLSTIPFVHQIEHFITETQMQSKVDPYIEFVYPFDYILHASCLDVAKCYINIQLLMLIFFKQLKDMEQCKIPLGSIFDMELEFCNMLYSYHRYNYKETHAVLIDMVLKATIFLSLKEEVFSTVPYCIESGEYVDGDANYENATILPLYNVEGTINKMNSLHMALGDMSNLIGLYNFLFSVFTKVDIINHPDNLLSELVNIVDGYLLIDID